MFIERVRLHSTPLSYLSVPFFGVSSLLNHQDISSSRPNKDTSLLRSPLSPSKRSLQTRGYSGAGELVSDGNLCVRNASSPRHHGPTARRQCLVPTAVSRVYYRAETDAAIFERKVNSSSGGVFDHNSGINWSAHCDDKQRVGLQGATRER